ncbi:hypothetical protein Bbelb_419470 [Branchiostoma belcheri]|nr:hypothetical protein Bbelb_419470 [Branchiostoma belcheri]
MRNSESCARERESGVAAAARTDLTRIRGRCHADWDVPPGHTGIVVKNARRAQAAVGRGRNGREQRRARGTASVVDCEIGTVTFNPCFLAGQCPCQPVPDRVECTAVSRVVVEHLVLVSGMVSTVTVTHVCASHGLSRLQILVLL